MEVRSPGNGHSATFIIPQDPSPRQWSSHFRHRPARLIPSIGIPGLIRLRPLDIPGRGLNRARKEMQRLRIGREREPRQAKIQPFFKPACPGQGSAEMDRNILRRRPHDAAGVMRQVTSWRGAASQGQAAAVEVDYRAQRDRIFPDAVVQ